MKNVPKAKPRMRLMHLIFVGIIIAVYGMRFWTTHKVNTEFNDLAGQCEHSENPDSAIQACNKLLDKPNVNKTEGIFNNRGWAYLAKTEPDLAIQDFQAALKKDPNHSKSILGMACAYEIINNYDAAIEYATKAIHSEPKIFMSFFIRANAYEGKGQEDLAAKDINDMLLLKLPEKIKNNKYDINLLRGDHLFSKGQLANAKNAYDQYLLQAPENADAFFTRGITKFYTLSPAASLSDFLNALKIDSSKTEAAIWLQLVRFRADNKNAANARAFLI